MSRSFKLCSPQALRMEPGLEPEFTPEGPDCPECNAEMLILSAGNQGGSWWFHVRCPNCNHEEKDDNF